MAEGRGWDRGGGSRPMVKPALQSVARMCACTPGLHNTQDSCGLNQWHLTQRHCFAHAHAIPVRCMLLPSRAHPHNTTTTSTKQPLNLPPVIHVAAIHLQNVIEGDDQAQPRHYLHTHAPLQMSLWGGLSCLYTKRGAPNLTMRPWGLVPRATCHAEAASQEGARGSLPGGPAVHGRRCGWHNPALHLVNERLLKHSGDGGLSGFSQVLRQCSSKRAVRGNKRAGRAWWPSRHACRLRVRHQRLAGAAQPIRAWDGSSTCAGRTCGATRTLSSSVDRMNIAAAAVAAAPATAAAGGQRSCGEPRSAEASSGTADQGASASRLWSF